MYENFANFDNCNWTSTSIDNQNCNEFSDEEFADFKSASNEKASSQLAAPTQMHQAQRVDNLVNTDWVQLFRNTFPTTPLIEEYSVKSDSTNSSDTTGQIFDHASSQSQLLWASLQEMDLKTVCLLHKWKDSHSFKRLLQALKLDANIVCIYNKMDIINNFLICAPTDPHAHR